jgi:hypothetical protein
MQEVINVGQETRPNEVRDKLYKISERVIQDYCELADLLFEVWEGQYHKEYGYKSFSDYVEAELDIRGRKAHFLVQITKTMRSLGIAWEEVREVGWRKMACITPLLTHENHEKWIEEAKTTSLTALSEKIKAEKKGEAPDENPTRRMGFQLDEDQYSIVQSALDYAKRYEEVKSNADAITRICYMWVQEE